MFLLLRRQPGSTLFPYTTLFRSLLGIETVAGRLDRRGAASDAELEPAAAHLVEHADLRSEEHTSELQSRFDLVCRLLLEKKKDFIIGRGYEDVVAMVLDARDVLR